MKERFPGELETSRADNARLRRLLELSEEQARGARPDQATLTGAPTTPVSKQSPFQDKVRFYIDLFRCRSDVYAIRWENRRDGRSGWMPAVRGGYWRKGMSRSEAPFLPLTNDVVDKHLQGEIHIGLYPLLDDDTCWWVAADFDKEAAMLDALAFMKAARAHSIPAALEVSQSGRDAHAGVAYPGSVDVARRSVDVLRRVRDAGWPPGAGRPTQRDLAHAAYGFQRIPPSWRFRRREHAATAAVPLLVLCQRHRSRRHHRTNLDLARAVADPANDAVADPVPAITLPGERTL
jgi:hypothetical protein